MGKKVVVVVVVVVYWGGVLGGGGGVSEVLLTCSILSFLLFLFLPCSFIDVFYCVLLHSIVYRRHRHRHYSAVTTIVPLGYLRAYKESTSFVHGLFVDGIIIRAG